MRGQPVRQAAGTADAQCHTTLEMGPIKGDYREIMLVLLLIHQRCSLRVLSTSKPTSVKPKARQMLQERAATNASCSRLRITSSRGGIAHLPALAASATLRSGRIPHVP